MRISSSPGRSRGRPGDSGRRVSRIGTLARAPAVSARSPGEEAPSGAWVSRILSNRADSSCGRPAQVGSDRVSYSSQIRAVAARLRQLAEDGLTVPRWFRHLVSVRLIHLPLTSREPSRDWPPSRRSLTRSVLVRCAFADVSLLQARRPGSARAAHCAPPVWRSPSGPLDCASRSLIPGLRVFP